MTLFAVMPPLPCHFDPGGHWWVEGVVARVTPCCGKGWLVFLRELHKTRQFSIFQFEVLIAAVPPRRFVHRTLSVKEANPQEPTSVGKSIRDSKNLSFADYPIHPKKLQLTRPD
tara:strand:- start:58 stop:399 length:342 start_codon:yes stop_codon:yes gene_type:complete